MLLMLIGCTNIYTLIAIFIAAFARQENISVSTTKKLRKDRLQLHLRMR